MRTTLSIDPEVLSAAKKIAAARSKVGSRHGFPVFEVPSNAPALTPAQVREDDDEA